MRFSHYLERVHNSAEFKKFKNEHKGAYLCAGFFVLDFETDKNIHQIDYYLPRKKKIAAFVLDEGVRMHLAETFDNKKPVELEENAKIDLDVLKGIVQDEMKNKMVTEELLKIIAVLQNVEGKKIWNLSCILSGFGLLKVHIDDETGNILKFEKASMLDFIKRLS